MISLRHLDRVCCTTLTYRVASALLKSTLVRILSVTAMFSCLVQGSAVLAILGSALDISWIRLNLSCPSMLSLVPSRLIRLDGCSAWPVHRESPTKTLP